MLDYRDWVSYLYVPILMPILVLLPYVVVKSYQRSHRVSQLVDSLSQGSRDLAVMTSLLEGPMKPWASESVDGLPGLKDPDFTGFEILQDSRIIDLRSWNPRGDGQTDAPSLVYGYRRLKIHKRHDNPGN